MAAGADRALLKGTSLNDLAVTIERMVAFAPAS
jgi:hypothetical protein